MTKKLNKIFEPGQMFGITVMGARGQVVIPVQARKALKINQGDRLVAVGQMGKALGLIKAEELSGLIKTVIENLSSLGNSSVQKDIKKAASKFLTKKIK